MDAFLARRNHSIANHRDDMLPLCMAQEQQDVKLSLKQVAFVLHPAREALSSEGTMPCDITFE
eukprot:6184598-Prorocentrum_lima.AAC.1